MFRLFWEDMRAVHLNDPAAKSYLETLLCHTPMHAIWLYRVTHLLHTRLHVPVVPRFLSAICRFWSGVEIHPGAVIGRSFFIDHGTGVVIGETAEIGDNCVMFHNVTLGGTGKHLGKRHPTVEDNVLIGTASTTATTGNCPAATPAKTKVRHHKTREEDIDLSKPVDLIVVAVTER